jgi:formimidoylglutamate deiminase
VNREYCLESALLPEGWTPDTLVRVSDEGMITMVQANGDEPVPGIGASVERVRGVVVPGMPNAHSHAFQRAMAGATEYRLSARDSFWTWRQAMYALANRIEPAALTAVATQLFIEMLKAGYTSVAEFHYVHRRLDGTRYVGDNAIWDAVTEAATSAGIGLTFLPTLYQTGDFGGEPLRREQARFELQTDEFLRAVEARVRSERRGGARALRTGAAFHSLRAVPLGTLREASLRLRDFDTELPLHIHVAEQLREVEVCLSETGRRPIELLLDSGLLNSHWCLIHATHATPAELQGIAAQAATVCVSISTEANLGDGFFDTNRYLKAEGRLCIGSDSQATVSPAEELRWLEYQQRLKRKRRGVLANRRELHVGTRLWRDAALHGAQAIGQDVGAIAVGRRADWLVLDSAHPAMAGCAADAALDHLVFAGASAAIRDVMVAGRWVVKDYRHAAEDSTAAHFATAMNELTIPVYTG